MLRPLDLTRQRPPRSSSYLRIELTLISVRFVWPLLVTSLFLLQLSITPTQAQQGVETLTISSTLTPDPSGDDLAIAGRGSFGSQAFLPDQTFNLLFNTGIGNTALNGFSIAGTEYSRVDNADEVVVRREGNTSSNSARLRYFAESLIIGNDININPTRPINIRDILMSNTLNRGVLDVFRNIDNEGERANNVERLDIVFTQGITAPAGSLNEAGFIQIEKNGNNPFQIAAITGLNPDGSGTPATYGDLIFIQPADYGLTNVTTTNTWFENDAFANPVGSGNHGLPGPLGGQTEPLGAVFISLQDLGLSAGQTFFGYSTFANDIVPGTHTLTDPSTFPQDTGGPLDGGSGADFYGGTAAYFASAAAQNPSIGIAKAVVMTTGRAVTLCLHIENFGDVPLTNLSLVDDLDLTFGAGHYAVTSAPTLITPPATSLLQLNTAYTGEPGATAELLDQSNSSLAVGEFAKIEFTVTVTTLTDQGNGLGIYSNSAVGGGDPPSGPENRVIDNSTDGSDPDADGNNDDGTTDGDNLPDEDLPTPITVGDNQPPVAIEDSTITPLDTPVTFSATENDTDSDGTIDPATVDLDPATPGRQTTFTVPGQGTFDVDDEGNVTFTPETGFTGTATIPYTVDDNDGSTSAPANLIVTVQTQPPVSTPPIAVDDRATTPLDTPVTVPVTANDTDSDGTIDPATVDLDPSTPGRQTTLAVPGEGTYTVDDNGNVTFTPEPGFTGTSELPYTVNDNTGTPSNPAILQVTVEPVETPNTPPLAVDDRETTAPNTPITVAVLNNDSDPDGDPLTVTQVTQPSSGTATLNLDGTITYTPAPDTVGPVMIPYVISDGRGGTATAILTIDLTDAFNPPLGLKTGDSGQLPQLAWTIVWINADNVEANAVNATDNIPANTTYTPDSLTCTPRGASTVEMCTFDATANRIVYVGTIAPDPDLRTEAEAANEVVITYNVTVPTEFNGDVDNQAEANWDANGSGSADDEVAADQIPTLTDDPMLPGTSDPTIITISRSGDGSDGGDGDNGGDGNEGGEDPSEGGTDNQRTP